MPTQNEAAAACAEILVGLDEDTLEYVSGGIVDIEDKDELVDFVAGMLDELCDGNEDAARAKASALWDRLHGGAGASAVAAPEAPARAPISLGSGVSALEAKTIAEAEAARGQFAAKEIKFDHAVSTAGNSAAAKDAARVAARQAFLAEEAAREAEQLASELEDAGGAPPRCATGEAAGSRLAVAELGPFNLPNPGGGADLLENATATLAPGHRYGLIGRNGKGKSTLLKFLASRRVPGFDPSTTVHYVSQEVSLTQEQEGYKPAALVVEADVERRLLLEEAAALTAKTENRAPDANEARSLAETHERLLAIDAEGAPGRAAALLHNLGFPEALVEREMRALSGGVARARRARGGALRQA